MSWGNIDEKLKRAVAADKKLIPCFKKDEFGHLVRSLLKEFPEMSISDIGDIVWKCCNEVGEPRQREDFIACLKKYLQQE